MTGLVCVKISTLKCACKMNQTDFGFFITSGIMTYKTEGVPIAGKKLGIAPKSKQSTDYYYFIAIPYPFS